MANVCCVFFYFSFPFLSKLRQGYLPIPFRMTCCTFVTISLVECTLAIPYGSWSLPTLTIM